MQLFNAFLNGDDQKGMVFAVAVATFLFIAVSLLVIWYLIKFNKIEFQKKFINKKVIYGIDVILGLNIPIIILNYVFGFVIYSTTKEIMVILISISFILTILVGIYLFFFLQIIVIGINENEIVFLGEKILINKITRVEKNEKLNQLIIFYTEGSRNKKKCKYSLSSRAGKFMLNNSNLLNKPLEVLTADQHDQQQKKIKSKSK